MNRREKVGNFLSEDGLESLKRIMTLYNVIAKNTAVRILALYNRPWKAENQHATERQGTLKRLK